MPVIAQILKAAGAPRRARPRPAWPSLAFIGLTAFFATAVLASFANAIELWTPIAVAALPLVLASAAWVGGGAATSVIGLFTTRTPRARAVTDRRLAGQTAILLTLCGEDPEPIARYLAELRHNMDRWEDGCKIEIFVLSDTPDGTRSARETAALAPLHEASAITYRRRRQNSGRKPGNIAEWVASSGDRFDYMLVLDADSRMSAARIGRMILQLENSPRTGLLQAGIGLVPGHTRFGRHQRIAARLLSPVFVRGFASWTGSAGNYWGHNALIRVAAFRAAVPLPRLSGKAPLGGQILSHDFVEAALIRRAGWDVRLDAELPGSAEDAPQTLEAFHRRDRRWCQGNLQHLRLLAVPGLHTGSRFHLASGAFSYLAAPIWLALVTMAATGALAVNSPLPFLLVALLLLLPKVCALWASLGPSRSWARRGILLRAAGGELLASALLAPLVMVRQTGAVLSVLAGQDCGWKSGRDNSPGLRDGWYEALVGAGLSTIALAVGTSSALWLAPMLLPLLFAPLLVNYFDGVA